MKKQNLYFLITHLLYGCLVFPLSSQAQSPSPLTEIAFYGFQHPQEIQHAPHVSLPINKKTRYLSKAFDFDKPSQRKPSNLPDKAFHYVLHYKGGYQRALQVFESLGNDLELVIWIKEKGAVYEVALEEKLTFLEIHHRFKYEFSRTYDINFSEKSMISTPFEEEDQIQKFVQVLEVLSFPDELKDADIKAQQVFADGLIRRHLHLYQRYYNFPKVREMILDNFEKLAQDLADVGMPVRLRTEVGGCTYYPVGLVSYENKWQYFTSGEMDFRLLEVAAKRFNLVVEGGRE